MRLCKYYLPVRVRRLPIPLTLSVAEQKATVFPQSSLSVVFLGWPRGPVTVVRPSQQDRRLPGPATAGLRGLPRLSEQLCDVDASVTHIPSPAQASQVPSAG